MSLKLSKSLKDFLFIPVPESYKAEFKTETNLINLVREKNTAITCIILEFIVIIATVIYKKDAFLETSGVYYLAMYVSLIAAMTVFLLLFHALGKNASRNADKTAAAGIVFLFFLLFWCAGISLLDQLSSGQIAVYAFAAIAVAVIPFISPAVLLIIYLAVHTVFLSLLPGLYQGTMLAGIVFNTTLFIVFSFAISRMRYKSRVKDFLNGKLIQEKSDELVKINRELETLSRTDPLTGVFNRLVFDKMINVEWNRCKRHTIPLSLIMIDIDFFKAFNDNYGHQAGDGGIKRVAKVLSVSAKRSADTVTRYGGDEFALILPHMDKSAALELARNIRDRVFELKIPNAYSSCANYLTISIGVHTLIPYDEITINEFIRTADIALYEAKHERNAIVAE